MTSISFVNEIYLGLREFIKSMNCPLTYCLIDLNGWATNNINLLINCFISLVAWDIIITDGASNILVFPYSVDVNLSFSLLSREDCHRIYPTRKHRASASSFWVVREYLLSCISSKEASRYLRISDKPTNIYCAFFKLLLLLVIFLNVCCKTTVYTVFIKMQIQVKNVTNMWANAFP